MEKILLLSWRFPTGIFYFLLLLLVFGAPPHLYQSLDKRLDCCCYSCSF
eukprot:12783.XXX_653002_653148_1 [CDS] Oithona nana genome sequencing.